MKTKQAGLVEFLTAKERQLLDVAPELLEALRTATELLEAAGDGAEYPRFRAILAKADADNMKEQSAAKEEAKFMDWDWALDKHPDGKAIDIHMDGDVIASITIIDAKRMARAIINLCNQDS